MDTTYDVLVNVELISQYIMGYLFLGVIDYFGSRYTLGNAFKAAGNKYALATGTGTTTHGSSGPEEPQFGETSQRVIRVLYGSNVEDHVVSNMAHLESVSEHDEEEISPGFKTEAVTRTQSDNENLVAKQTKGGSKAADRNEQMSLTEEERLFLE